jgi:CheY-like chemotaxis protein
MVLECLLVTCDPILLGQIKSTFSAHASSLELRQDSVSALEVAGRRHFDGLVIDCDQVVGGVEALTKIRNSRSNKNALIIAVINGLTSVETALDSGANFVLSKPVQEARLQSVFDIAFPKMECEHRRYFRYETDLPVRLRNHLGESFTVRMKNVSEGGLALKLGEPVNLTGVVPVEFDIPSIEPQAFQAKADVVWSNSFEVGLRFLYVEKESGIALKSWLHMLDAQSQLRESNGTPSATIR